MVRWQSRQYAKRNSGVGSKSSVFILFTISVLLYSLAQKKKHEFIDRRCNAVVAPFCDVPLSRALSLFLSSLLSVSEPLALWIWCPVTGLRLFHCIAITWLFSFSFFFLWFWFIGTHAHIKYSYSIRSQLEHFILVYFWYYSALVSCFQVLFVVLFLPRWLSFNAIPLLQTSTRKYVSSQQKYGFNVLKCWKKKKKIV